MEFDVIVEVPRGQANKYEADGAGVQAPARPADLVIVVVWWRQTPPTTPRAPIYSRTHTDLTWVYAFSTSWPISRPQPDCL
jgi:hypothetical protein